MPALTSDVDRVRLKIGDVDMTDPLLTDTEIETHIRDWPTNLDLAAANAAESIAGRFARDFTFGTAGGQTFNRRERVLQYMALAEQLRSRGGAMVWPTTRHFEADPLRLRWDLA